MTDQLALPIPEHLKTLCRDIAETVRQHGGRALLVGGCVRDGLRGVSAKDIDIEVYGIEPDRLETLLRERFRLDCVGRSFCVLKLKGHDIDIAIPRRESKSGSGHRGFAIQGDPFMAHAEAARRRDFTLNAISWDPLNGELIDPCDGRQDLADGILRHTSEQFAEDPLRVLRAMQFLARFELSIAPETLKLCRSIEPEDLPRERIFEEWHKLIVKGLRPSVGLNFLRNCGWVRYFPELEALIACPQDPKWHPEGDVWTHTLHAMDAFAQQRIDDDWENLVVGLGVLCHDMGKPVKTFAAEDGHIRSPGHEKAGEPIARAFLARLTENKALIEAVIPMVLCHDRPWKLHEDNSSDAAIRRLAKAAGRIDRLVRVAAADTAGRPPRPGDFPAGPWLLERAAALEVTDSQPKPLIQGRHLIDRELTPGPHFREILDTCYEAQLDGDFTDLDGGLTYLNKLLEQRN